MPIIVPPSYTGRLPLDIRTVGLNANFVVSGLSDRPWFIKPNGASIQATNAVVEADATHAPGSYTLLVNDADDLTPGQWQLVYWNPDHFGNSYVGKTAFTVQAAAPTLVQIWGGTQVPAISADGFISADVLSWMGEVVRPPWAGRIQVDGPINQGDGGGLLLPFRMRLTDGSVATGKTVRVQIIQDGGAIADAAHTPATEVSAGFYKILLTSADINARTLVVLCTAAGCADTETYINLFPEAPA